MTHQIGHRMTANATIGEDVRIGKHMLQVWKHLTAYVAANKAVPAHIVLPGDHYDALLMELECSGEVRRMDTRQDPLRIADVVVVPGGAGVRAVYVGR